MCYERVMLLLSESQDFVIYLLIFLNSLNKSRGLKVDGIKRDK